MSDEAKVVATRNLVREQAMPVPTGGNPIWDLVIEDMRERDRVGRLRYGTPLQAGNGRDVLVDAYQEALDLTVYLRQTIEERELLLLAGSPVLCERDGRWGGVRDAHLEKHPTCAACGADRALHVHHILPVHRFPEWELDPANLITLCAARCHLLIGHLTDWTSYNPHVIEDSAALLRRIEGRPNRRVASCREA